MMPLSQKEPSSSFVIDKWYQFWLLKRFLTPQIKVDEKPLDHI